MGNLGMHWKLSPEVRELRYVHFMRSWQQKPRNRSEETKERIRTARRRQSLAGKAPESSLQIRKKISAAMKKFKLLKFPKCRVTCGNCGKVEFVAKWRFEQPYKFCSRRCANIGKEYSPPKVMWCTYKDKRFRSCWEKAFAKWLDERGELWEYERYRFTFPHVGTYTPDFYLLRLGVFVEVKGIILSHTFGDRFRHFVKKYGGKSIVVLLLRDLVRLGLLDVHGKPIGAYR